MFSVVIPLYNKEDSISNTIQSVLSQSYRNFELLIINDGSTDNSLDIVRSIDDSRIVIVNQSNSGVSNSRNSGIAISRKEWIVFLDADDLWKSNYLQKLHDIIQDEKNEISIIVSGYSSVLKDGTVLKRFAIPFDSGFYNYFEVFNALGYSVVHTSAVCIKKSLLSRVGMFNERLTHGEDIDLWERIAKQHHMYFINDVYTMYIQDSENRAMSRIPDLKNTRVFNIDVSTIKGESQILYFKTRILRVVFENIKKRKYNVAKRLLVKYKTFLKPKDYLEYMFALIKNRI